MTPEPSTACAPTEAATGCLLDAKLISSAKHSGDFFGAALQPQDHHRRGRDYGLPSVAMVASDIDNDISLTQLAGNKID